MKKDRVKDISEARVIRVFVSSTFRDLQAERNALQEKIFPQLHDLAFAQF